MARNKVGPGEAGPGAAGQGMAWNKVQVMYVQSRKVIGDVYKSILSKGKID